MGRGGGEIRGSDFFTKNPNLTYIFLRGGGGRWTDRHTGPNQFAPSTSSKFTSNLNLKYIYFLGVGGAGGRWMDRRTGPNQFAHSTSSRLGHNNA